MFWSCERSDRDMKNFQPWLRTRLSGSRLICGQLAAADRKPMIASALDDIRGGPITVSGHIPTLPRLGLGWRVGVSFEGGVGGYGPRNLFGPTCRHARCSIFSSFQNANSVANNNLQSFDARKKAIRVFVTRLSRQRKPWKAREGEVIKSNLP